MGGCGDDDVCCKMYSPKYFLMCACGGALAYGITHTFITPLHHIRSRMGVDPYKYHSIPRGYSVIIKEGGIANLFKGWAPTLIGYSLQGAVKFSLYEFFKHKYTEYNCGDTNVFIYLAAAASAELFSSMALSPFEVAREHMQSSFCVTSKMMSAMREMAHCEGSGIFYRGLPALWGRQIPYTMMKFTLFEKILEYLYCNVVSEPCEKMCETEQLTVTFAAGCLAGVLCAIVTQPTDTIFSKMSRDPKASVNSVLSDVGMVGLWRGLLTRIIMIGTLSGFQWLIYDGFKVYTRMPRCCVQVEDCCSD